LARSVADCNQKTEKLSYRNTNVRFFVAATTVLLAFGKGPNEIDFAAGLHGTITLSTGELLITRSVTINGPGANQLAVSGNNASRIFDMTSSLNVNINHLTITLSRRGSFSSTALTVPSCTAARRWMRP
jgi:hypothetical protein